MSFGIRIEQRGAPPKRRSSADSVGPLAAIGIVFLLFCIFDYSPYGHGYVAASLGGAQRWFQGFAASFKVRI